MKKNYLPLLISVLLSGYSFGQEVVQKQNMLITKITATWCPNCGTSAWDNKKEIIANYPDAVFLTTHISTSSKLYSSTARDYARNLPSAVGQPIFYINRDRYNTGGILNATETAQQTIQGESPLANAGLEMKMEEQVLNVKARVQFFEPANGEFYLSLFVIEDKVMETQASRGSGLVEHSKVLRGRVTSSAFGVLIADGSINANETFDFRINRQIPEEWNQENLEVAAIIWQKNGDIYEFVNTQAISDFSVFTSVNELAAAGVELTVNPTLLNTQSTVAISLPSAQKDISLQLINTNGQLVTQLFRGDLSGGLHHFPLTKPAALAAGIYLVRLVKDGHSITEKIVVK